jgi:hypothetical protein
MDLDIKRAWLLRFLVSLAIKSILALSANLLPKVGYIILSPMDLVTVIVGW